MCTPNQSMKQKSLPEFKSQRAQAKLTARTCPCLSSRQADPGGLPGGGGGIAVFLGFLPASELLPSQPLCRPISLCLPLPQRCCSASGFFQSLQKPASSNTDRFYLAHTVFFVFELALTFKKLRDFAFKNIRVSVVS